MEVQVDKISGRATKKKRATSPASVQRYQLEKLLRKPDRVLNTAPLASKHTSSDGLPNNTQGSSAGAGSGEFHLYNTSRRREDQRLQEMGQETSRENEVALHEERMARLKEEDEIKTAKNRRKREKAKHRKEVAKLKAQGIYQEPAEPQSEGTAEMLAVDNPGELEHMAVDDRGMEIIDDD